jgi:hypothetical protein
MILDAIDVADLCSELDVGWGARDLEELEADLAPYTGALFRHLGSGDEIASHVPGSGALCVPITDVIDPHQLFAEALGDVGRESFEVRDFGGYFLTVHHSTVPVVMVLLKTRHGPLAKLEELCARSSAELGAPMGQARYLQWNQPGFGWPLHTDDDFDGVATRVHVPLVTTPQNRFAWAPSLDAPRSQWLLETHLERGKVYRTRVDVPHTAWNEHPTDGRLHLILDVASAASH